MSRRRERRKQQLKSTLDLTNMIDVVFTLLIIFMITAPMMTQGVQVELPQAKAKNVETNNEMIQVVVNKENKIFINDVEVAEVQFETAFSNIFNGRKEIPVFVSGDRDVPYGIVMSVITKIQKAGAVKLGFLTEPLPKE